MDICWNKDEEKQINKYNGQYVIATLSFLNSKATENELLKRIVSTTGKPHKLVELELKRILNIAVIHGFVMKIGNTYLLPSPQITYQIDSDAETLKRIKKEPVDPDSESEEECDKESEEQKYERLHNDYINTIEEIMKLDCILFRNQLLSKIIDVVVEERKNKKPKCEDALAHDFFEVTKLPDEHVDAFTKDKLKMFYSTAYDLLKTHKVGIRLLRYTHESLDKALLPYKYRAATDRKREAIDKYINEVETLEKGDCEKFRTVYICYLLNIVAEALQQGKNYASEIILHIRGKNSEFNCALKNFVLKAFVLGKLDKCYPMTVYLKILSDRAAKAPKVKAKGAGKRKRKCT